MNANRTIIPRSLIISIIIMLTILTPVFFNSNPTINTKIDATISFNTAGEKNINNFWGAFNIWDVSIINDWVNRNYTPSDFKSEEPSTNMIVLMTATGGRSARTNEYVFRSANGSLYYNFTMLDIAIDWIMEGNYSFEFVIGNTPHALVSKSESELDYGAFDALTYAPENYTEYKWYIENITRHCIDRWGLNQVSKWQWRLMTEPDNEDWWVEGTDEYVKLWINTFETVKTIIPNAKLVLGNMEKHWNFEFVTRCLNAIKQYNESLLPDTISFSYYHSLKSPPDQDDLHELLKAWEEYLPRLELHKNFSLSVEEGQILQDEDGKRLWSGDASELGGAWQGWMISSCIHHDFSRFVQWAVNYENILAPKGFVQLAADKMVNLSLDTIHMESILPIPILEKQRMIGGFAGHALENEKKYAIFLYYYSPSRTWSLEKKLTLHLSGIQQDEYTIKTYIIDKDHHNFFSKFLNDSSHLERISHQDYNDGSIYDLLLGYTLGYQEGWEFLWNWTRSNDLPHELKFDSIDTITIDESTQHVLNTVMHPNSVTLIEINSLE
ncbi:MAG: GH39 family glycosyl hydrolase [Promethearchaeota archaeon]